MIHQLNGCILAIFVVTSEEIQVPLRHTCIRSKGCPVLFAQVCLQGSSVWAVTEMRGETLDIMMYQTVAAVKIIVEFG